MSHPPNRNSCGTAKNFINRSNHTLQACSQFTAPQAVPYAHKDGSCDSEQDLRKGCIFPIKQDVITPTVIGHTTKVTMRGAMMNDHLTGTDSNMKTQIQQTNAKISFLPLMDQAFIKSSQIEKN
ncbi:MAG: hypothetical protein P1U68_07195 [Verrucomicrobiales bacterium]|nr:hypothetical protein [Verrucomicrobiales bacterium]